MPAASPRGSASSELLSIGQVLSRLTPEFPDLTASKFRFLELQGIVTPARTESGYRKFSSDDVERLRLALQLQRDHYMPHSVIREHLADIDARRDPAHALPPVPPSIHPQGRRYRREELIAAAGARPQLLHEAISAGLIGGADSFGDQSLMLLRALAALETHGIEPRHLRAMRQGVDRDIALVESALAPLLRRNDAKSRATVSEVAPELIRRLDEVRAVFVQASLGRILP